MKVHELISHLQKFNPQSEVCFENREYDFERYFKLEILPKEKLVEEYYYSITQTNYYRSIDNSTLENKKQKIIYFPQNLNKETLR